MEKVFPINEVVVGSVDMAMLWQTWLMLMIGLYIAWIVVAGIVAPLAASAVFALTRHRWYLRSAPSGEPIQNGDIAVFKHWARQTFGTPHSPFRLPRWWLRLVLNPIGLLGEWRRWTLLPWHRTELPLRMLDKRQREIGVVTGMVIRHSWIRPAIKVRFDWVETISSEEIKHESRSLELSSHLRETTFPPNEAFKVSLDIKSN